MQQICSDQTREDLNAVVLRPNICCQQQISGRYSVFGTAYFFRIIQINLFPSSDAKRYSDPLTQTGTLSGTTDNVRVWVPEKFTVTGITQKEV